MLLAYGLRVLGNTAGVGGYNGKQSVAAEGGGGLRSSAGPPLSQKLNTNVPFLSNSLPPPQTFTGSKSSQTQLIVTHEVLGGSVRLDSLCSSIVPYLVS